MKKENPIINAIWKKLEEKHGTKDHTKILAQYEKGKKTITSYTEKLKLDAVNIITKTRTTCPDRMNTIIGANPLADVLNGISDNVSIFKKVENYKKIEDIKDSENKKRLAFLVDIENYIVENMNKFGIYEIIATLELKPFVPYLSKWKAMNSVPHSSKNKLTNTPQYHYVFKSYTEFETSLTEYFINYWDGVPNNIFGENAEYGFSYLNSLQLMISSLVCQINKNEWKFIPAGIYNLTKEWLTSHVIIFNEPIIQKAKEREKFKRKPNQVRMLALKRKMDLVAQGKTSLKANAIVQEELEKNPEYETMFKNYGKENWKKFLQLPKSGKIEVSR